MRLKAKLFMIFWLAFSMLVAIKNNNADVAIAKADSKSYVIDSFAEVPSDWTLYSRSDVDYTNAKVLDNELLISHNNESGTQADKYYGGVYQFNTEEYTDFTFKMEFSIQSFQNEARFIGLIWHSNIVNNYLNGLYMNYRVDGRSASSVIYGQGKFKDDEPKIIKKLVSGEYYTLKVIMNGDNIYHYIDDTFIASYNAQTRYTSTLLTEAYPRSGGFGLLVNKSSIKIRSISITDEPEDIIGDVVKNDEELVSTYRTNNNLINFPTVVTDIKTNADLELLQVSEEKPSNAILRMNKDKDIVDVSGNKIDSFKNIFQTTLKKEVIPIVRVEDTASADALVGFLNNEIDILDMAVMSSKPELVKKVKTAKTRIRGIISFENSDLSMSEVVQTLNLNYANVAIFSENMANIEDIYYVQARFKTVWVNMENDSDFAIRNIINSSCYGIISNNYTNIYEVYTTYDTSAYVHPIFNAAHRGLPNTYHENSVSGVKAAIEAGATHLEIDCYLTTDNKVVLMHDSEIARTTNGEGNIETFSLEQLREYKLDLFEPYEDIPILEDIIEATIDSDAVLILEVKSAKTVIANYIREVLESYDFFDRVVFITFNSDILGKIKNTIPECPTAYLGTASSETFASNLVFMGQYNTIYDTNQTNGSKVFNEQYLRDRGLIGWFWTFDGAAQIEITIPTYGYVGITNNNADRYSNKIKFIRGISVSLENGQDISALKTLKVETETYDGSKSYVDGEIVSYEDKGTYYNVICSYYSAERIAKTYYTQAFVVYKANQNPGPDPSTSTEPSTSDQPSASVDSSVSAQPSTSQTPSSSVEQPSASVGQPSVSTPTSTETGSTDEDSDNGLNALTIISLSLASVSIFVNIVLIFKLRKKRLNS